MKKVRVLGLPTCGHCRMLIDELTDQNIPFLFINVDGESKIADFAEQNLGTENYPIILIGEDDNLVYVYQPDHARDFGRMEALDGRTKIGAFTIDGIIEAIKTEL